ncbi:MAG: hypothetical protein EAZ91_17635 [Cytophagales bacterium]|nr:MAG: hypothetical protein EAZ91_17635 [Cytophagales bacterium]
MYPLSSFSSLPVSHRQTPAGPPCVVPAPVSSGPRLAAPTEAGFPIPLRLGWVVLLLCWLGSLPGMAQTVRTFNYTGDVQTFVVPAGVTTLSVVANGAQGHSDGGSGGLGGQVTATLAVTPRQSLSIYVGGSLGFNGGGGGVNTGGGATDIRIGGSQNSNRVVVAGGGGGNGYGGGGGAGGSGGAGGGLTGGSGGDGANGINKGGAGGTGNGGGTGGTGNSAGGAGISGEGGGGGSGYYNAGGGGGGYFGGGGGAASSARDNGGPGGGGGGSSYTSPSITSFSHTQGANTGDGSLTLSYVIPPPPPTRLYVNAAATAPGDGLSWATAFPDLQQALTYTNVSSLTAIWVAGGVYKPTSGSDRTISFAMLPGVAIYGGFAGTETSLSSRTLTYPSSSTLSGDIGGAGNGDNSYNVIENPTGLGLTTTAILDGFVITGGNANGNGNGPDGQGGGMYNNGSSPTVRNCLFQGNSASQYGGAMYNVSSSNPVLTNCAFIANSATDGGGGIYNQGTSPVLTNCSFQGNTSSNQPGQALGQAYGGNSVLTNCVFFDNGGDRTFTRNAFGDIAVSYSLFDQAAYSPFALSYGGFVGSPTNLTTSVSPFVDATSVALSNCSPAINAGDNAAYTTANGPATDLAGQPRLFAGGQVDMGALELQSPPVSVSIAATPSLTITVSTISATLTASGASSYTWSTGQSTSAISASIAGTYSVTGTTSNGCSATASAILSTTGTPVNAVSALVVGTFAAPANCMVRVAFVGSGRQFLLTGPGGYSAVATYRSPITNRNIELVGISQPGVYTLVASGVAGQLTSTTFITVTGTPCQAGTFGVAPNARPDSRQARLAAGLTVTLDPVASVYGTNRRVRATITGGTPGTLYSVALYDGDPATANDISSGFISTSTSAGSGNILTYTGTGTEFFEVNFGVSQVGTGRVLEVYDINGNFATGTFADTAPFEIQDCTPVSVSIAAAPSATICAGSSATLTASGADSYAWSNSQSTTAITVSAAGVYSVTGTTGACSSATSVTVAANPAPTTLYVNAAATGANTGLNWTDAFTDLQSVLTNPCVSSLTAIWVAQGTYKPTGTAARTESFRMLPNVAVYGGFPNTGNPAFGDRNPASFSTILSGDIGTAGSISDNSYHVVVYGSGVGTPILDGVIITGGNANGSSPNNLGGGMLIRTNNGPSSPRLNQVTITQNSGQNNGGIAVYANGAAPTNVASPTLTNCVIASNTSTSSEGGGISLEDDGNAIVGMTLTSCTLVGNIAQGDDAGALFFDVHGQVVIHNSLFENNYSDDEGGAIFAYAGSFTITNSQFLRNTADYGGGALFTESDQYGLIDNCLFDGNSVPNSRNAGAILYDGDDDYGFDLRNSVFQNNTAGTGGALYVDDRGLKTTNCLFINNTATNRGGGIYAASASSFINSVFTGNRASSGGGLYINSSLTMVNSTVASNSATGVQGGGIYATSDVSLINAIIWGNTTTGTATDAQLFRSGGTTSIQNSLIQEGLPTGATDGGGNLLAVTVSPFVSATNLQLNACTPAIDAGDNAAYASAGGSTSDVAGNARTVNALIDMGAYEFSGTASQPVGITAQPVASSVACSGTAVTATVSVTGSGAITYQWFRGTTPVASQTTATLSLTNVQSSDAGSYSVVVTGACGSVTSTAFSLTVNQSIGVTQQPAATSVVCTGASVTVFISATGDISGYQWFKGTTALTGQTSATLTLSGLQPGDTDGYTAMVLSTSCGIVLSNVFNLTVQQNVGITMQPATGTLVCSGATVTATVSASGTGPLAYEWIKGQTLIPGQTTATLTLTNVQQATDADDYRVRVFTGCNNVLSDPFGLSINQAVAITAQPAASSVVCVGSDVTATVSFSGSGPFTFEWYKGATRVASQTTATLSLTNVQTSDAGSYSVRVITPCNTVSSTAFSLTVQQPVTTASLLSSGTLTCGNPSVTLTTTAANATNFTLVNTGDSNGTGQFVVAAPGSYTVRAGAMTSCTNTALASVSVSQNTAIGAATLTASSPGICPGAGNSVTLTAGTGSTYTFLNTSGMVLQTGSVNTYAISTAGTYSVVVSEPNGCTAGAVVSVSLNPGAVVLGPVPMGGGVCEGRALSVPVSVTATGNVSFQWLRNGVATGQNTATLTLGAVTANDAGIYVLVATGACNSQTSTAYQLSVGTVTPSVVITFPSGSSVTVSGSLPTITVPSVAGANFLISGGDSYEHTRILDRINGYEFRQFNQNTSGLFPINGGGPYRIRVVRSGCDKTVEGVIVVRP